MNQTALKQEPRAATTLSTTVFELLTVFIEYRVACASVIQGKGGTVLYDVFRYLCEPMVSMLCLKTTTAYDPDAAPAVNR